MTSLRQIIRRSILVLFGSALFIVLLPWIMRGLGYYVDNPGWQVGEIAAKRGNHHLCSKIRVFWHIFGPTGPSRRAECIFRYASLTKDPTACELLLPGEYGLACLSAVAGKILQGIRCHELVGRVGLFCRGETGAELAVEHPQIQDCSHYRREDAIEWCHFTRTYQLSGVYECEKMPNDEARDECETGYAFKQKDTALCAAVKDEQRRRYCEIMITTWLTYPELRGSFYFGKPVPID